MLCCNNKCDDKSAEPWGKMCILRAINITGFLYNPLPLSLANMSGSLFHMLGLSKGYKNNVPVFFPNVFWLGRNRSLCSTEKWGTDFYDMFPLMKFNYYFIKIIIILAGMLIRGCQ